MVDLYYPYFEREAAWQELKYSLRSVDLHIKHQYRVWIVGDLPPWINPETVCHIPHQRSEGMKQNTLYDATTKLLVFCDHPETSTNFIRMYDDIYLLDDVSLIDIGTIKAMYDLSGMPQRDGIWWNQLKATLGELKKRGMTTWNTETHLPELFNKNLMKKVISDFDALNRRLLTSSLYFNSIYSPAKPMMFHDTGGIQFYGSEDGRFYTSNQGDLAEKCRGKRYLNHNNGGLNDNLKRFLMSRFTRPSKFEK